MIYIYFNLNLKYFYINENFDFYIGNGVVKELIDVFCGYFYYYAYIVCFLYVVVCYFFFCIYRILDFFRCVYVMYKRFFCFPW